MATARKPVVREFGSLISDTRLGRPSPFLKWAGGKGRLLKQMAMHFPSEFETYLEPFLGGGAVFFYLHPKRSILSDSNSDLIQAFSTVRDDPEGLMAALDRHYPYRKRRGYYGRIRAQNPADLNPAERAARTIFLNKTCYNGLYRVNRTGQFNVPFGRNANPSLYDRAALLAASTALKGSVLTTGDYRWACQYAREGDFVYLDPPYHPPSATANFTGYTRAAFGPDDQKEVASVFVDLDRRNCKVMLSNSATSLIESLYHGYKMKSIKAKRVINSNVIGRGAIEELLIINY
jgi:DNA adenine methylase